MACGDDVKTLLSRYVDGELSPEERSRVEEHTASCAPCRELLQIFQKNESLLSNALSTESFGNAVIESVISEIKREAAPVEAKPVDDGPAEMWVRSRPFLQLAAAAALIIGLVVVLNASHKTELEKMAVQVKSLSTKVQENSQNVSRMIDEHERTVAALRFDDALRRTPDQTTYAYVDARHLIVKSSFDLKKYGAFELYRRGEGEANDRYVRVNGDRRLDSPEFIDTTVKPGQAYVYKFRAFRSAKDEEFTESHPITMRVPRTPDQQLAVERSIRIQCVDIGYTLKVAKFLLHRVVDGKPVSEEFAIRLGEKLGEIREVPGFGKVDFRTNLTLDKLENGNQTLTVNYTTAVLDPSGKPVIERVHDGTIEVKTVQQEGVLSIRPNDRAYFRTAGAIAADVDLWKGGNLWVRSQD